MQFHCSVISFHRIENAGGVSCFLDSAENIEIIQQRLNDFGTNIILCDLGSVAKLNCGDESVNIICNVTLFDKKCVLLRCDEKQVQNESDKLNKERLLNTGGDDKSKSSAILFYATTSGSCGEVKQIGVTYKCFSPNIDRLG